MKCTLRKASEGDVVKEIEIGNLSDLLTLVDESEVGSIVFSTKKVKEYDNRMRPVYERMDVPEIIIYDDYIE